LLRSNAEFTRATFNYISNYIVTFLPPLYRRTHLGVLSDPNRIFAFGEVLSKKEAREEGWEGFGDGEESGSDSEDESMVPLDEEAMKVMRCERHFNPIRTPLQPHFTRFQPHSNPILP